MKTTETHENYPIWIVILSNIVSILIYTSGFIITLRLGWIAAMLYLVYILALEYRLISKHCVNCCYWGMTCGFGKGRLSALFFKRGDPVKFCINEMSWKDMIPDMLVSLLPFLIGIVMMIIEFKFTILAATIVLILLTTFGNGFIRENLTCRYCKQKGLGCPAEKLFTKDK